MLLVTSQCCVPRAEGTEKAKGQTLLSRSSQPNGRDKETEMSKESISGLGAARDNVQK